MILAHLTDIHLDCVTGDVTEAGRAALAAAPAAEAVIITGDLATASTFPALLPAFAAGLGDRPVFFVLGNHDAWGGTIARSRQNAHKLSRHHPELIYLPGVSRVALSDRTALVGVDGWYDARVGNVNGTKMHLNDWRNIGELTGLHRARRIKVLQELAQREARRAEEVLRSALADGFAHVVLATHVPPFPEASVGPTGPSDNESLPYYCNYALGLALSRIALDYPGREITVLCGHCHGAADVFIHSNLRVITGAAIYGTPSLAGTIDVP